MRLCSGQLSTILRRLRSERASSSKRGWPRCYCPHRQVGVDRVRAPVLLLTCVDHVHVGAFGSPFIATGSRMRLAIVASPGDTSGPRYACSVAVCLVEESATYRTGLAECALSGEIIDADVGTCRIGSGPFVLGSNKESDPCGRLSSAPWFPWLGNATPSVFHQRHIGRVLRSS